MPPNPLGYNQITENERAYIQNRFDAYPSGLLSSEKRWITNEFRPSNGHVCTYMCICIRAHASACMHNSKEERISHA